MIDLLSLRTLSEKDFLDNLPDVLADYEDAIDEAEQHLSIKGKTAVEAAREQCAWPIYYSTRKAEVGKLLKYAEMMAGAAKSRHYRRYTENYSRDLGDRGRDKYIEGEEDVITYRLICLEIEEVYNKLSAVCDAFDRRGFALRDWTQLTIASLTDTTI